MAVPAMVIQHGRDACARGRNQETWHGRPGHGYLSRAGRPCQGKKLQCHGKKLQCHGKKLQCHGKKLQCHGKKLRNRWMAPSGR